MSVKDVFRKRFIVNTVYFGLILAVLYIVLKFALPLVSPFIMAFLIAFIIHKPSSYLSRHTKLPQKLIAFSMVIIFYGLAGTAFAISGIKVIGMITERIAMLPTFYEETLSPMLISLFNLVEITVSRVDPDLVVILNDSSSELLINLRDQITSISFGILASVSNLVTSLPTVLLKVMLMVISTFFISLDYDKITSFMKRQVSSGSMRVFYLIRQYLFNTLFVVIRSYLMIMTLTFTELSIAFSIIGIKNALLVALIIAIFDILPVLGTGGVMIPWAIITLLQGELQLGLSLFAIYGIVTVIRNIVEPKIVGGQLGIHPVVTLMSMFVGANLLGALGLFGFPIALSLLNYLNEQGELQEITGIQIK